MDLIRELLTNKNNEIHAIEPDVPIFEAIKLMAEKDIGALMVMKGERLVGVISERDYARKIILKGLSSRDTKVEEIMTRNVVYARPDQSVNECMALMTEKHIRHLPIMDEESVLGVVSIGDLVKSIIEHQKLTIKQLEQYVSGDY